MKQRHYLMKWKMVVVVYSIKIINAKHAYLCLCVCVCAGGLYAYSATHLELWREEQVVQIHCAHKYLIFFALYKKNNSLFYKSNKRIKVKKWREVSSIFPKLIIFNTPSMFVIFIKYIQMIYIWELKIYMYVM